MKLLLLLPVFFTCSISFVFGYGSDGHRIVGAIADEKLGKSLTGEKVKELLDGINLTEAAVLPDQIKQWDKDKKTTHLAILDGHPKIEKQLADFWNANSTDKPRSTDDSDQHLNHHWFHYTDVPVFKDVKYADGKTGRSKWDIVHLISYCIQVLKGEVSEENSYKITKPVAVILLAHYVGDIHQPLHVGAEYFDAQGHPCDPDQAPGPDGKPFVSYEDQGGNSLLLTLTSPPYPSDAGRRTRLHGYWDVRTVNTAWTLLEDEVKKQSTDPQNDPKPSEILRYLATQEPANWALDDKIPLSGYAEAWANDILPVAKEAHDRLDFSDMVCKEDNGALVAYGSAVEAKSPDSKTYEIWSGEKVREAMQKGGWRLADLLTKALQ